MAEPNADGLTDAAKAEIAAAIAIVREDRMEKFMRERLTKHTETKPDDKPKPGGPPPEKDPPPEVRKSGLWWGEVPE